MGAPFIRAAEIAATQHGRITTAQLRACGIGKSGIERGVAAGRLHRVQIGVFALGHLAPSREATWHESVLACGDDAVLSRRCAATAFEIRDGVGPRVDVTVPSSTHRRRPGIAVHRADLLDIETTRWHNIPITSPARTMVDLAHELEEPDAIEWAVREMQYRRLFDRKLVELSNLRRPNREISRILDGIPPTRSRLEVAFVSRVVRRHRLPAPECQYKLHGFRVDFCWPQSMLVVETDGRDHELPAMKAADAVRDDILGRHGWRVLRFTWVDVHRRHAQTAARIRAALMNKAS